MFQTNVFLACLEMHLKCTYVDGISFTSYACARVCVQVCVQAMVKKKEDVIRGAVGLR